MIASTENTSQHLLIIAKLQLYGYQTSYGFKLLALKTFFRVVEKVNAPFSNFFMPMAVVKKLVIVRYYFMSFGREQLRNDGAIMSSYLYNI